MSVKMKSMRIALTLAFLLIVGSLSAQTVQVNVKDATGEAVKGMRDHIAHGYFDINTDFVWDVVKNDLTGLRLAIEYFKEHLYEIIPFE
jgi:uncharacterized protein with HEPN domain